MFSHQRIFSIVLAATAVCLLFVLCSPKETGASGVSVTLVVTEVDAEREGTIRCALFGADDEWLGNDPTQSARAEANGSRARCRFDDVSAGRYGVSALHDEDGDREMDRTLGIPSEGYAISLPGERGFEGTVPPDFEDAAIEVSDASVTLRAPMNY